MKKLVLLLLLFPLFVYAQLNSEQIKLDGVKIVGLNHQLTVGVIDSSDIPSGYHTESYLNTKYYPRLSNPAGYLTSVTLDSTTITGFHTVAYYNTLYYPLGSNPSGYLTTETDPQFNSKFAAKTTTDLTEGANLYFTNTRARNTLSAGTGISYDATTGVITNSSASSACSLDSFSFTNTTSALFNTVYTSNGVIISASSTCVLPLLVRGDGSPQVKVNSNSWGVIDHARVGDTVYVRLTSANTALTTRTCTLYTEGFSTTFSVTTDDLLFLDINGSSAVAAYSCARKLRVAYAGSAIRVRRSSDNTEQDIGFTASHNLDTTALKTFVGAGSGFITKWYDQTVNSHDLAQATNGNQPRIVNAGVIDRILGKPSIFNSASTGNLKSTFTYAQPIDWFCVWQVNSISGSVNSPFDGANGAETAFEIKGPSPHGELYAGSYLTQTYPLTASTPLLTSVLFNGGSSNAYKNGSSYVTGAAGANAAGGIVLFNNQAGSLGWGLQGYISEFIAYSADKTSGISDINTDINTYYSIY